jgi:hypothetical protein
MTKLRLALALPFLFACSMASCGGQVSLGDDGDAGGAGGANDARDAATTLPDGTPAVQDGLTGTWTGYVESYHFASGSDALTVVLASDGKGNVAGTIAFGAGTPRAPATNPDVADPPVPGATGTSLNLPIVEAMPLALHDASLTLGGTRLQFAANTAEAWKPFCELQTATYDLGTGGPFGFACLPNTGGGPLGSACAYSTPGNPTVPIPVDCGKLTLCTYRICACTATGCTVNSPPDVSFDLVIGGSAANGSTTGRLGDKNVHLTRVK